MDSAWQIPSLDVFGVIARLPTGSVVADCGCHGWTLAAACSERGHHLVGLDRSEPPNRPAGARFVAMEGAQLRMDSDECDLTVASHVLEHLTDPLALFGELARITRPGGLLWLESPSELSALARGTDDPTDHTFQCFWDDPTHVRPFTPGALYRLALTFGCVPLHCQRAVAGSIPVSRLLAEKPRSVRGTPPQRFVSLRDVPPGLAAAWAAIWSDRT